MNGLRLNVHRRTGRFVLDVVPDRAIVAFTARGEQGWVPGWHPVFRGPAADPDHDDRTPGTVFETDFDGHPTIWTVLDHRPAAYLRYSRVAPGISAGTVSVTLTPVPEGTEVEVVLELTALTPAGEAHLAALDADPAASVSNWRQPVSAFLRESPR